ncbi:MAG: hypothetical protein CME62_06335 [Halobacteriovoraceae bacterium]|nr:hypothetical protein [Halobacteriovoraceae bacterium]|tara:strand:+ start:13113 stop:13787 length:675 start_codon:yes stop_codon:yes gene_type:complete
MEILFEDKYVIAVTKPAKQFVHPMQGEADSKDCLLFSVRDHIQTKLWPINRLDRPVSGIVLFAKSPEIVTKFQDIWHLDSTQKKYTCLHRGLLEESGVFNSPLSKRSVNKEIHKDIKQEALTLYNPLQVFKHEFCTLTEVEIKTGRYHQIRRHFRKAVMPIIGDRKHGKGVVNNHFLEIYGLDRIFLHAKELIFIHPYTSHPIHISCTLPIELLSVLKKLKNEL